MTEEEIFDPKKLHPAIKVLQGCLKHLREAISLAGSEMSSFKRECEHHIVRDRDSARCQICGDDFGWWCPKSPNHQCDYPEGEEQCRFCGEPDERK
jgi:hypothetical protein